MSELATPTGDGWEELPAAKPEAPKLATPSGDGWEELPAQDRAPRAVHEGILTRGSDEGPISSQVKNVATGAARGVSSIPGAYGDLRDTGRYVGDRLVSAVTGKSMEDIDKQRQKNTSYIDDALDYLGKKTGVRPHLPSGEEIYQKIVEPRVGRYEPKTAAEKMIQGAVAAGVGGVGLGSVTKAPATIGNFLTNAGAGAAGEGVTDLTGDPLLGMAAGAGAAKFNERVVAPTAKAVTDPLLANVSARKKNELGAKKFFELASDPEALKKSLEIKQRDSMVPGDKLTTGQAHGDIGLLQEERRLLSKDEKFRADFNERQASANEARREAIQGVPSDDASARDLVTDIERRHNLIEKHYDEAEKQLIEGAKKYAEKLGESVDAGEIGQQLRDAIQKVRAERQKAIGGLYKGLENDNTLRLLTTPIKDALAGLRNQEGAFTEYSGHAGPIMEKIEKIPDVMSFKDIRSLGSKLAEKMASERMANGETESYRALRLLNGATKDAINTAAARQIEWRKAAGLPPDPEIEGRIGSVDDGAPVSGESATGADERAAATGTDPSASLPLLAEAGEARPQGGGSANNDGGARLEASAGPDSANTLRYPGGKLGVRYKVVDLDNLKTSHDLAGVENPNYPQELQGRNRASKDSIKQVIKNGDELDPELLGHSKLTSHGAPVVGPDGVVESGNGRVLSITHNYNKGDPAGYRKYIESLGHDTTGMKRPVLVAERTGDMTAAERKFMADQSNAPGGLRMNATEQAGVDTSALTPDVLAKLGPGNLKSEANADFVNAFLSKLSVNDRGGMMDPVNNRLTPDGEKRLQAAVLQSAFGDTDLVQRGFTSSDNNIKNITGAMADSAGNWAKMRAAAKEGAITKEHDVTGEITDLVKDIMKARDEGRPVSEVINQADMLRGDVGNNVRALLMNGDKVASRAQITARLNKYAEEAVKNTGGGFLDDKVTPAQILKTATGAKFEEAPPAEPVKKTQPEGKPADDNTPNMSDAAAKKLAEANRQYGEYAKTFKRGAIGSVLRTEGYANQYKVKDSSVIGAALKPHDTGYETAKTFLQAAKNSKEAVGALKQGMINRVLNTMDNGVVNPKKLETLTRNYAGALRAIEEVSPGFVKTFENAKKASEALTAFAKEKKQALAAAEDTAAAKFIGLKDASDIQKHVGQLINANNVGRVKEMVEGMSPEARAGMQRAAVDWMLGNMRNVARPGLSETPTIRYSAFDKMLDQKRAVLNTIFTKEQMSTLRAVRRSMVLADRTHQATQVKGSPGTEIGVAEHMKAALDKAKHSVVGRLIPIEAMIHSPLGALLTAPFAVGLSAISEFSKIGANRINDVVKQAIFDPEFARQLVKYSPREGKPLYAKDASVTKKATLTLAHELLKSFYRTSLGGNANEQIEERRARASGGRLNRPALTAKQLISGLEAMRKSQQKHTEVILNKPDETVVRALHHATTQL